MTGRLAAEAAARELGLTLIFAGSNTADDFEQAFAAIDRERADALMDMGTPVTWANRRRLIDFAAQRHYRTSTATATLWKKAV